MIPNADPEIQAKAAIAEEAEHNARAAQCRLRRDAAIHGMRAQGLRPPEIARRLDVSESLVRLSLRMPRPKIPPENPA